MRLGLEPHLKRQISPPEEEMRLAQSLLEQIMDSFKDAERVSERFKKHSMMQKPRTNDLVIYDAANSDLDPSYQRLHQTMCELANQRQKGTSMRKKAVWALYEKKRFDTMIEDVTKFVGELVELFPAAQEDQEALVRLRYPQSVGLRI